MQGQTIGELKMEFASGAWMQGRHTDLLPGLADGRFQGGLTRFQPPAGTIDLSRAKTPLFADHQHRALPPHKAEGGSHCRLPIFPERIPADLYRFIHYHSIVSAF